MQASLQVQRDLHDDFVGMVSLELWSLTSFHESVNLKSLHTYRDLLDAARLFARAIVQYSLTVRTAGLFWVSQGALQTHVGVYFADVTRGK